MVRGLLGSGYGGFIVKDNPKEYQLAYNAKNGDRIKKRLKEKYAENPELYKTRMKAQYYKNKAKQLAKKAENERNRIDAEKWRNYQMDLKDDWKLLAE
tara:strand:+ start:1302 stop:1595 length:294 start_codon:yes stop_codon:yes gene_type:complete